MIFLFDGDKFDWAHFSESLVGSISAVIVLFLGLWAFHREDRRDRQKKANDERQALLDAASKLQIQQQAWHEENKNRLTKIETMLEPIWRWWNNGKLSRDYERDKRS